MDSNLSKYIDHTLLAPTAKTADYEKLCREALEHKFFCVCVNSSRVSFVHDLLKLSDVKIASVVGFPHGANSIAATVFEAELAVKQGAHEIDMVNPIGALKERDYNRVFQSIRAVVSSGPAVVKVILETGLLTYDEKILACQIAVDAGAHFVKTCTGFNVGSATVEDVRLMRHVVGPDIGVKASGGIRDRKAAELMISAGANRLGTSSGVQIVKGPHGAATSTNY